MLNRHAIVLFLGLAALSLLRGFSTHAGGVLGAAFLLLVVGLLLDSGQASPRTRLAHLLQAAAVLALLWEALHSARTGAWHLLWAELGIAAAVSGLLLEMIAPYRWLRPAVALQAVGDVAYLSALLLALGWRTQAPSTIGWVFIALVGLLAGYAAGANLLLQISRLGSLQAGWRYRVLALDDDGLAMKTQRGKARVAWSYVEAIHRLDGRHLLLVLPAPLPETLRGADLPLEELRDKPQGGPPEEGLPQRYALILHEQELGRPLAQAEQLLRDRIKETHA